MFSRTSPPSAIQPCPSPSPCKDAKAKDDALTKAVAQRVQNLTGEKVVTQGTLPQDSGPSLIPGNWSPCQKLASSMGTTIRQFNRYSQALPSARAAFDMNRLDDEKDDKAKRNCLTMLSESAEELNVALGLPPGTLTDADLLNDKTGFRAAIYRSESDGRLILVARDTQPHSLEDWKTNTDNGQGQDTAQYFAMRKLAGKLAKNDVSFDVAGYSKGGGLAQEAGLMSPKSKIFVFNSAGLSDRSLERTGQKSFESLQSRTVSFSSEGDFLTYMNNTTDPAQQISNARYLRNELDGSFSPIEIEFRNPEMKAAEDGRHFWQADVDPNFEKDKKDYLEGLDKMIAKAEDDRQAEHPFRLFPPVQASQHETIPNSMTKIGSLLGAKEDEANLGRLYQHKMDKVLDPMESLVKKDRELMENFLKQCP